MTRKSRPPKKLELVDASDEDEDLPPGAAVHRLTGDLRETLETIITGCALLAQAEDPVGLLDGDADEVLDSSLDILEDALDDLARTTRVLAQALIARVLGLEPPPVGPHTIPANGPMSREDRYAAIDETALLLREVGLEMFDVWSELEIAPDGTPELFTQQVSAENAHVSLLEFVFDRAQVLTLDAHPIVVAERDAWSWEFSRWSVSAPPGTRSAGATGFSQNVREHECAFIERRSPALGMSVMARLATQEVLAEVCPRQHRLAEALTASFVDLFQCVAVTGNRVTLESVRDGKTFEVYEHLDVVEYSTGWLCAGRLLPFGDALYLRSPGMIFVQPPNPDLAYQAAAALNAFSAMLPPALALEATISSVVFKVAVPRVKKPAQSKAHARGMFEVLSTLLAHPDFALETTDPTFDTFMGALAAQADSGGGASGQKKARRGKKTKRR